MTPADAGSSATAGGKPGAERGAPPRWARVRLIAHYFGKDVRKRRPKLLGGMAFGVIYALARVAEPWPLKVVLDQVLFQKPAHGFWIAPFTVFGHSQYALLSAAGLLLALAGVVRGVSYYYEDYLLSSAAQEVVYGIRTRLYRHLHCLPVSYHQSRRTGDTLVRLSSDIVLLRDVLIDGIVNLGTGLILIVLMLAVMLVVDPVLTLSAIAVMPLIVLLSALYGRRIRSTAKRQRKREGQVAAVMHEAIAAISVVQLHGAEEREQERFHEINRRSLKEGVKTSRVEARLNRSVELALTAGTVVVLWAGTARALHGKISPGELVVFLSYLRAAYRPLRRASKTVQRSAKALSAAERIVEVLATEPELADAPDARPAPPLKGGLSFEDVDFAYRPGLPVLEHISLAVEPGRRVAIVGATGSGKSTLLSLVPRLFDPGVGRVTLDGHDVREFTLESVRNQISMVQQESVLFGLSLAENIRYGCPDASDEEVRAAGTAAGLDEFVERLPDGYDTVVSERGASLSGGQRQRVAIARALVRRSPILILDEPTTGLDAATQRGIFGALRRLMHGTTTLLVTHHIPLVREADEIVLLERGRVVARGSYDELMTGSPLFRRLASDLDGGDQPERPRRAQATAGTPTRVLFYSHNGVGVGHLQRQLDLATAYRGRHPDSAVLLSTGSHGAGMFRIPAGIDYLKLPSIAMVDDYLNWESRDLPLPIEDVIEMRSELLLEAVRRFSPDLLVADFMPAGPCGELLPALDQLERAGGRAVAGFRDVIGAPEFVRAMWESAGVYEVLRQRYGLICVYSDPRTVDFADEYALDESLAGRLRYCGYLGRDAQEVEDAPLYERPFVLASTGGGVDGAPMLEAFARAAVRLRPEVGGSWLMVTGPLMSDDQHRRLSLLAERAGVTVRRLVPGLRTHVALADCVVAMAGYNTVCDVLSYRRPAVLVPRSALSGEQRIRAERMEEWGAARVIAEEELHPDRLAAAIAAALTGPAPPSPPVPLGGLENALDVFDSALDRVGAA